MNLRSIRRAARVALAAGVLTTTVGGASAAHAATFCSPQPKPTITMTIEKGIFAENEFTSVLVSLSNPSCTDVSVDLFTQDGSAVGEVDYGEHWKGTPFTFSPGMTLRGFVIWGIDDWDDEQTEWFTVNLGSAKGGTIAPASQTKWVFIDGSDAPPQ